ncbi:MAG: hypothetical protein HKN52_07390 [Eudoraea sp.]|nr:hypothetical protein [Eudoraea sp.]
MTLFFKIFSLLFFFLFAWAAFLQWNDPDAYLWYFIYGIASVASLSFYFRKLPTALSALFFFAYLIGTVFMWPEKFEGVSIGDGAIENIERGREALGLLIAAFAMLVYAVRSYKSRKL